MTDERSGERGLHLCLAGDVMLGRGIDQIQAHPGDPWIDESWAHSAELYVELAERESGAIPRCVDPSYVWGELLSTIRDPAIDAFIVNLETAVTDRGRIWPGKGIQYRMNPANLGVLTVAGVDVANVANNHVLDWSEPGLLQTLVALREAGIEATGAGENAARAWRPARVSVRTGGVVVMGVATPGSGVPADWAAGDQGPGVALLADFSDSSLRRIREMIESVKKPGDVVVLSIHWGGNWGYGVSSSRRRFARRLIEDAGVHLVHGHSSHHPTGIEVHEGHLILYGCGDLITDYEGIGGHEGFRGELGGLYVISLESEGRLTELSIVPTHMRRLQLTRPSRVDTEWLARSLDRASRPFGTALSAEPDGRIELSW